MAKYQKKAVEEWLRETDYRFIGYMPKATALLFVNFIKEVNTGSEENETPLVHLKMMDRVFNKDKRCAILCHRGIGKTTVFAEYLFLFIAAFGIFPGFGNVNLCLYVTDSIENGVKNLRRNVEYRYGNSDFLQRLIPNRRITVGTNGAGYVGMNQYESDISAGRKFTDIRLEFKNNKGHILIVKGYGAKALSLDTALLTERGITTIRDCQVGNSIFGPSGALTKVIGKSEIFHRPMYQITLEDGRCLRVCEEHINSVVCKENPHNTVRYIKKNLSTKELLQFDLQFLRKRTRKSGDDYVSHENLLFIENTKPLQYQKKEFPVDPYTLGLLLGDGSMKKNGSTVLHAHKDDLAFYEQLIPYSFGSRYVDKRNTNVVSLSLLGLYKKTRPLGVHVHGDYKFIPIQYFLGSIDQRLALLQGLMDTDGSIQKNGRMDYCSNSIKLINNVMNLVRSLGGTAKKRKVGKAYRTEIWISKNIFRLPRKADRFTGTRVKDFVAIISIDRIKNEPSQCIAVDNEERQFLVNQFIRTHNTGVRGAKELGQRPTIAILDDLVSDTDAESPTVIKTIENTVYKAVSKALHPTHQKMVWLGTPFNARDPLYKAVESGAWRTSVYPICEHYPCEKKDFRGSWEDRFPFEYIKDEYEEAQAVGAPENFNQELMLRIMSDEERLIEDSEIQWYAHRDVVSRRAAYNCYITTDFAVSEKEANDFSVISVWLYNNKGFWYWVDGICKKQLMDKNFDDLFRLAQKWNPLSVGIEVSGQQQGFIVLIQKDMIVRNIFFNLASDNNGSLMGIRPNINKMVRFSTIVPWFKNNMMFFPSELKESIAMKECVDELSLASKAGLKSKHDDFIDTISMLGVLVTWRPSESINIIKNKLTDIWEIESNDDNYGDSLQSYIV